MSEAARTEYIGRRNSPLFADLKIKDHLTHDHYIVSIIKELA